MAGVSFRGVGKVYSDGTRALEGFDLDIADGEFMVFVGPSGCGKTTALRMLAGLEAVTEGAVLIGDRVVNKLEPQARDVAMIFQNYALYPQMSVYDNIAFGLRMRKVPRATIRRRVEEIAGVLGMADLLARKPAQLSGGQRQRVAMGRAIVREPALFLMDEPLSNLDAQLRVEMRVEIARIQRDLGVTTVYVTHDQVEALTMGHRVCVLSRGRLQQVGAPQEIYDAPANLFVARFLGSPSMNLLEVEVEVEGADGDLHALVGGQRLALPRAPAALASYAGRSAIIGLRPESVGEGEARIAGEVRLCEALGAESLLHLDIEGARTPDGVPRDFVGRMRAGYAPRIGERVEVPLDAGAAHFFDPESGWAIR
jgi:multiple sugar transport system ATP-binding protein